MIVKAEDLQSGHLIIDKKGYVEGKVSGRPEARTVGRDTYVFVSMVDPIRRHSTYSMRGFEAGMWTRTYMLGDDVNVQDGAPQ